MDLSEFAFRITLMFIPGLIAFKIFEKLTFHKEYKASDTLFGGLTLGFASYLIYYFIFIAIPNSLGANPQKIFYFSESLSNPGRVLNFREILIVTIISIPIGLVFTALVNQRLLYKFANRLRISDIADNLNVWVKVFDSPNREWVVIRDLDRDLMYQGIVEFYSDGAGHNEIFLRQVEVHKISTQDHEYSAKRMYFKLGGDNFIVEFVTWMSASDSQETKSSINLLKYKQLNGFFLRKR